MTNLEKLIADNMWKPIDEAAASLHRRLMAKRHVSESGCWEFTGYRGDKGYGRICHKGHVPNAHRAAYEIYVGPIPDGMFVMHKCDNPPCFNPSHLMVGTAKFNSEDMVSKKRNHLGSARPQSKLTEKSVLEMRLRHMNGEGVCHLAREYKIGYGNASEIISGRWWRHVPYGEALTEIERIAEN